MIELFMNVFQRGVGLSRTRYRLEVCSLVWLYDGVYRW